MATRTWTPEELSVRPVSWLDASDCHLDPTPDGYFRACRDKEGNTLSPLDGYASTKMMTGAKDGKRTLKGDPSVSNVGLSLYQRSVFDNFDGATGYTWVMCYRHAVATTAGRMCGFIGVADQTANTKSALFMQRYDTSSVARLRVQGFVPNNSATNVALRTITSTIAPTDWSCVSAVCDWEAGKAKVSFADAATESVDVPTGAFGGLPWTPYQMSIGGARTDSVSNPQGELAEVLVFSEALPDADVRKLEGYLAHKWGCAEALPASHPYKSAAPSVEVPEPGVAEKAASEKSHYRDWLADTAPAWLQGPNGRAWFWAVGDVLDSVNDMVEKAVLARFSEYSDTTGLSYLGGERGVQRNPSDTDEAYAGRVRNAWETNVWVGTPRAVIEAVNGVLGGNNAWIKLQDGRTMYLDEDGDLVTQECRVTDEGGQPVGWDCVPIDMLQGYQVFVPWDGDLWPDGVPGQDDPIVRRLRNAVRASQGGHSWCDGVVCVNEAGGAGGFERLVDYPERTMDGLWERTTSDNPWFDKPVSDETAPLGQYPVNSGMTYSGRVEARPIYYIPAGTTWTDLDAVCALLSDAAGGNVLNVVNVTGGVMVGKPLALTIDKLGRAIEADGFGDGYWEEAFGNWWEECGFSVDAPLETSDVSMFDLPYACIPKETAITNAATIELALGLAIQKLSGEDYAFWTQRHTDAVAAYVRACMPDASEGFVADVCLCVDFEETADGLVAVPARLTPWRNGLLRGGVWSNLLAPCVDAGNWTETDELPLPRYYYLPKGSVLADGIYGGFEKIIMEASGVDENTADAYVEAVSDGDSTLESDATLVISVEGAPLPATHERRERLDAAVARWWSGMGLSQDAPSTSLVWPPPQPVPAADLLTGLIGHWDFGDGSSINMTSRGGSGDFSWRSWWGISAITSGKIGGGITFDDGAYGDYLELSAIGGAISASTWCKPSSLSAKGALLRLPCIVSPPTGSNKLFNLSVGQSGEVIAEEDGAAASAVSSATGLIGVGAWHHVALSFSEATGLLVWVDGAKVIESAGFFVGRGDGRPCIGKGGLGSVTAFNGAVDEFSVWKKAIGQTEVTALYNGGAGLPFEDWT